MIFSRGHATLELAVFVCRSVGHVTFLFSAPAHPSATGGKWMRPCSVLMVPHLQRLILFNAFSLSLISHPHLFFILSDFSSSLITCPPSCLLPQGSKDYDAFVRQPSLSVVDLLVAFPSLTPPLERLIENLPRFVSK